MRHIFFVLFLFCGVTGFSQVNYNAERITLAECIQTALESNYSVRIARNQQDIAKNNVTLAPFLPTLSANGRQNQDKPQTTDFFKEATSVDKNYQTNIFSADVTFNWRLFDGMNMFATYETKRELLRAGELNLRSSMEGVVADIATQYYYIITQENRLKAVRLYLDVSMMRYNQAQEKYNIGTISGLEMKQAKIDFNSDSSQLVLQEQIIQNAYLQLFEMMNISFASDMLLADSIVPDDNLLLDQILDKSVRCNTSLLIARSGQVVSDLDLKVARASLYPTLDFNSQYRINRSENSSSDLLWSRLHGVTWGFTLSAKLFNGLETKRKIKNAQMNIDNSRMKAEQMELQVNSLVRQKYNVYRKNITMIGFEEESAAAAQFNLEAAMERYRLGSLSGIEFREIQRSYIDAVDRKISALYQAKVSEIELLYLAGALL